MCVDYQYDEHSSLCATQSINASVYWWGLAGIVIECLIALATSIFSYSEGVAPARALMADGVLDIIVMIIASSIANQLTGAQNIRQEFMNCYPNQNADDEFWSKVTVADPSAISSAHTMAVAVAITHAHEFIDKVDEFVAG